MKSFFPVLVLASLCATTALATTYVRVEKDGTKTYSDRPMPGGVAIDVQPAQSYSAPPTSGSSGQQTQPQTDDFSYQSCGVTPENDSTMTNPDSVSISVVTSPALRPYDTVILTVDGRSVGQPGITSHTMPQPERGTHTVTVSITNSSGRVVCSVNSVFHVQRPGVNAPANRPRPTPR